MNDLENAKLLLKKSKNLHEVASGLHTTGYRNLFRYKKNPDLLRKAKYTIIEELSKTYLTEHLKFAGDKKYLPLVSQIKNYLLKGLKLLPSRVYKSIDPIIYVDPDFGHNDAKYNWEENNSSPEFLILYQNTLIPVVCCWLRYDGNGFYFTGKAVLDSNNLINGFIKIPEQRLERKISPRYNYYLDFCFDQKLNKSDIKSYLILDKLKAAEIFNAALEHYLNNNLRQSIEQDPALSIRRFDYVDKVFNSENINNEFLLLTKKLSELNDDQFWQEATNYPSWLLGKHLNDIFKLTQIQQNKELENNMIIGKSDSRKVKAQLRLDLLQAMKNEKGQKSLKNNRKEFIASIERAIDKVGLWFNKYLTSFLVLVDAKEKAYTIDDLKDAANQKNELGQVFKAYQRGMTIINTILKTLRPITDNSGLFNYHKITYLLRWNFDNEEVLPIAFRLDHYFKPESQSTNQIVMDIKHPSLAEQAVNAVKKGNFSSFSLDHRLDRHSIFSIWKDVERFTHDN